ncbi:hypothetical protein [Cylindrospermopsis raciborskii]|uniref:hypothetical protein n=1 Tax=Cylindrospermopsis raciborskii TaxID=77022 RepID=UPI0011146F69|nr:hypothetical protein [Cylindrospermopsis raciborskii]
MVLGRDRLKAIACLHRKRLYFLTSVMPSFKTPIAIPIIGQEDFSVWRSHLVKDQSWTLWFWVEVDLRRSPVENLGVKTNLNVIWVYAERAQARG